MKIPIYPKNNQDIKLKKKLKMKNPITVETTINLAPEKVWKLWTTPADIIQWNNPSEDWHTLRVENDLRDGGEFLFRMEAKDGSEGFDFCGKYDKVITDELIEYALTDGRKTRIQFIANGDATVIIETFEPEAKTPVDIQRDFCQGVLNTFKNYAETESRKKSLTSKVSIEIKRTTNELIRLISATNEEQFNGIPFEGSWCVAQVGDHLLKSYGLVEALNRAAEKTERLPDKEIEKVKKVFLDFEAKYKSAENILPTNEPIEKERLLKALQKRIGEIIEVIQTKELTVTCVGLPFKGIGELTRLEWVYVILFHTQRHIHQMKNILKSLQSDVKSGIF